MKQFFAQAISGWMAVMMIMTSLPTFARDGQAEKLSHESSEGMIPNPDQFGEATHRSASVAFMIPRESRWKINLNPDYHAVSGATAPGIILAAAIANTFSEAYHKARLRGEPHSVGDIANNEMLKGVAKEMVKSEEFWMGALGGHAASTTFQAAEISQRLIRNAYEGIRPIFSNPAAATKFASYSIGTIASVVTFAGWEAWSQLWRQGLMMCPAEYINKGHNVAWRVFKDRNNPKLKETDDFKTFSCIVSNIAVIMGDPVLRTQWEYNTERLHYRTGEFYEMVTILPTFATTGAIYFSWCGVGCSFLGGLGGSLAGIATLAVLPHWFTDGLTIASARTANWANVQKLITNEMLLREEYRKFSNARRLNLYLMQANAQGEGPNEEDVPMANFLKLLKERREQRHYTLTSLFEVYYKTAVEIQRGEDDIENAMVVLQHKELWEKLHVQWENKEITFGQFRKLMCEQHKVDSCDINYQLEAVRDAKRAIESGKAALQELALKAVRLYAHEVQLMNRYLARKDRPLSASMTSALEDEFNWTCDVSMKLRSVFAARTPEMLDALNMDNSFLQSGTPDTLKKQASIQINEFYLNTFDEDRFLELYGDDQTVLRSVSQKMKRICLEDAETIDPRTPWW